MRFARLGPQHLQKPFGFVLIQMLALCNIKSVGAHEEKGSTHALRVESREVFGTIRCLVPTQRAEAIRDKGLEYAIVVRQF